MWNFLIGKPVANPALMRSRPEAGQRGEGKVTQRTKTKLHGPSPDSRHMPEVTKERNERGFEEKHQSDLFPPELPHDFNTERLETKSH